MKNFKDMWEDAAANSVAGGGVSLPSDAMGKNAQKKKKRIYDGRTREGKKFVERILARRNARAEAAKAKTEEVNESLKESRLVLSNPMYNELIKLGLDKLMKKHDAYVNKKETDKKNTTNSTPSPMFSNDLRKLINKNKSKLKSVLEKYRKPTQAEIDADRKKDQRGKKRPSATSKSIGNKLYKNLRNQNEMKGAEEWQRYADLLAIKSNLIKKKNKPSSAAIHAINKKINALLKSMGVTEADAKMHLEALSKYDFRYYRTYELELKNRAYGYDVEQAFKKAGYDIYGGDVSVRGPTIKFNRYSKKWGTNEKKLKAAIKKVLGIDVDRL